MGKSRRLTRIPTPNNSPRVNRLIPRLTIIPRRLLNPVPRGIRRGYHEYIVELVHRTRTHNAEVRSSIDYLTERLTTDEHVAPKTTLRVAVLRRRLRGCRRQHRGPRLAGGVAATGLLRAEPDRRFRHGAEGSAAEAEAVGSHRLRASRHDETGRWSAR